MALMVVKYGLHECVYTRKTTFRRHYIDYFEKM